MWYCAGQREYFIHLRERATAVVVCELRDQYFVNQNCASECADQDNTTHKDSHNRIAIRRTQIKNEYNRLALFVVKNYASIRFCWINWSGKRKLHPCLRSKDSLVTARDGTIRWLNGEFNWNPVVITWQSEKFRIYMIYLYTLIDTETRTVTSAIALIKSAFLFTSQSESQWTRLR